ncbi:kinase-like domain-containing protein [Chaetomidium leptoderma]|uniref:non-specific serine/threonine protein kinase n=1 Tax=Chaetomidium leptoderma TaxID=669021 RepID=A0AAN6VES1_9PEZI|nr:kinase-like domain-containing protein [Chaetomidium leptoderma]
MSTASQIRYEFLEDVERLDDYRPGGYHPIQLGDRLHERYRVVHRLGHGTFSTIWLARDDQLSQYVAIKVCTADAIQQEVDTLSRLGETALHKKSDGGNLIPAILDRFSIQGPNDRHCCLVTAPARCSLADTRERSVCGLFQLDLALVYIHEQGLVHGDLHLGNILLQLPPALDNLSEEELCNKYGAPELEPVVRLDGKPLGQGVPSHATLPVWLGERCENIALSDTKMLLTDFEIRPPEARFEPTNALSFASGSDIWSLGCTTWSLLSQRPLFDVLLATEDDVAAQQVDVLGSLPTEWWDKWEASSNYFTKAGAHGHPIEGRCVWSWDRRFEEWIQNPRLEEGMATPDGREKEAFFAMVRWMLTFKPGDRPRAKQVLETEWMREWALPECGKVWG